MGGVRFQVVDPHALGMALVLARVLYEDANADVWLHGNSDYLARTDVADWLRAEVTRELLSQEVE
jgi:hypothetical protein